MPVIMFANVLISSFSGLLVPEFSRLLASGNYNRLKTVCDTIFKVTFIFSICVTGIFIIFANEISLMVYQSIEAGIWIKILAPLIFFMYIDNIIDNMLKGINEQVSVMVCNIIDLLVTIFIIFFIVPIMGMYGYILSIFVSELLNFTISSIQLKKKINYSVNLKKFIIRPIFACLVSYLLIKLFPITFSNFSLNTIMQITLFILFYLIFMIVFDRKRIYRKIKEFC